MTKKIITISILLAFSASAQARVKLPEGSASFSAKNATEATMTFTGAVEMRVSHRPTMREIRDHIDNQLMHLFGPMAVAQAMAVPKGEHTIKNIKAKMKNNSTLTISYDYEGTIVLEKGPRTRYEIILPIDPDRIYSAGLVGHYNPCTDEHYQDKDDFWYFWNPAQTGCRLKEGTHYLTINTHIERIKNQKRTYPEYNRLVSNNGEIYMTLIMGMDEVNNGANPNFSGDENARNFREIKQSLISRGYKSEILTPKEIQNLLQIRLRSLPYIERFTKKFNNAMITLDIFFGPTGIEENSRPFHYFFRHALGHSALMMYDGHSGLGGHLDLASIEEMNGFRFRPAKDKYQIYFFNSCSSYTYYNSMYFGRKRTEQDEDGTYNLDILTNGLATYFNVMHDTNLALMRAVEAWATEGRWTSYQELARQIDSDNLFGVNGDEDNPTRSPRR